ncbi:unnamed protein product [Prunus brigantina]
MTSEAPESTSPITITETEHTVRGSASEPIITDRTVESVQEQAVVENLMDKQAYRIETSFMAAMDSIPNNDHDRVIRIEKRTLPTLAERGMASQVSSAEITNEVETADADWRYPIIEVIMTESHEGICGTHQSGIKMRWLVRRHDYYWPSILKDYIEYARAVSNVRSTAPYKAYQPRPSTRLLSHGRSGDGP